MNVAIRKSDKPRHLWVELDGEQTHMSEEAFANWVIALDEEVVVDAPMDIRQDFSLLILKLGAGNWSFVDWAESKFNA